MATTKTKKYMPEVKATGKGTAAGALIGALIKKGVLDKEQTRTRAKQYRKLTGKGLSDGQAISKIKLYESLLIKPKKKMAVGGVAKKPLRKANNGTTVASTTPAPIPKQAPMTPLTEDEKRKLQVRWEQVNKKKLPPNTNLTPSSENFRTGAGPYSVNITPKSQYGGTANTSGRMTRLGNKIAKKTGTGKTVSTGLQRRYDKSVDKVIVKQLKKSTKAKMADGGPTVGDGNVETPIVSYSKKDLPFVNAATIGADGKPIGQAYANMVNKKMRTDSAAGRDVKNPLAMNRVGGAKMAKGGMTKAKRFAALAKPFNKATAADRIAGAKKNKKK